MKRWRIPLAGGAVALLLAAGYFFALHQPRADEIAQVEADTEQLRSQQADLAREIAVLEGVEASEDQFRAAAQRLGEQIPAELAQPAILTQLQAAAAAAGAELVSVTFGPPVVPEGAPESGIAGRVLVEMAIDVIADGTFFGNTDLLRRVEIEMDRAVLVGSVALAEAETGLPQLTGTWAGRVYALLPVDHPLLRDPATPLEPPAPADPPPAEPAPDEPGAPGEAAAPEEAS